MGFNHHIILPHLKYIGAACYITTQLNNFRKYLRSYSLWGLCLYTSFWETQEKQINWDSEENFKIAVRYKFTKSHSILTNRSNWSKSTDGREEKSRMHDDTSLLKRYGQVQFNEFTSGQSAIKFKGENRNAYWWITQNNLKIIWSFIQYPKCCWNNG